MSYIGNTPGVSSQRVVLEEVISGSPKSTFVPISGYIKGYVDVLINGSEIDSTDFTADDGVTVTLEVAAEVGDTVKIKTWLPRGLSDGYRKDEADAKFALLGASYTKTEADAKYALLAAAYTKTESDAKYVQLYSGKAGVGTTTPQKLFVVSNGGANGIEFSPDDASTSGLNRLLSYNRVAGAYQPLVIQGSEIRLYTKGASADQSFSVDSSGNISFSGGYVSAGAVPLARLTSSGTTALTGTASASTFLRGDGSWSGVAAGDISGVLGKARLPAGTILQAQSIFFSTVVSNTTRSFVNISGFAVTITPISANSKILILGQVSGSASAQGSYEIGYRVTRNGTSVGQNTNGSNYTAMSSSGYAAEAPSTVPLVYVDSPGSTSALTYQVQWMAGEGVTYYLNAPYANNSIDSQSYFTAGASSLILLEIAG